MRSVKPTVVFALAITGLLFFATIYAYLYLFYSLYQAHLTGYIYQPWLLMLAGIVNSLFFIGSGSTFVTVLLTILANAKGRNQL